MKTRPIPFSTLLANLADPNSQVRQQAITAIMRRSKERGKAFASLLTLLHDPDDQGNCSEGRLLTCWWVRDVDLTTRR
ncbi:MAG TPA: hypothetical protein VF043_07905 [Ktedonobacteraceae bacterium]